jgi:hypothetical protein
MPEIRKIQISVRIQGSAQRHGVALRDELLHGTPARRQLHGQQVVRGRVLRRHNPAPAPEPEACACTPHTSSKATRRST